MKTFINLAHRAFKKCASLGTINKKRYYLFIITMLLTLGVGNAWGETVEFDLTTKNQLTTQTTNSVVFTNEGATLTITKSSSGTAVNNYMPGGSTNASHTRVYKNNPITFDAGTGNKIQSITVKVTSSSGAINQITNGTWNPTVSGSGTSSPITYTLSSASQTASVIPAGTSRIEKVTLTYTAETGSNPTPTPDPDPENPNPDAGGETVTYVLKDDPNHPANGVDWLSGTIDQYTSWAATKGGTNNPKYYNTGEGLRVYNGGKFTITSTKVMTSITLTFSGTGYTFSAGNTTNPQTVTPNANSYEWSVSQTCRLQKIEITYAADAGGDEGGSGETVASLTANPTSLVFGNVTQNNEVEAKTFTISGSDFTTGELTITAPSGYTVNPTTVPVNGTLEETTITVTPNTSTVGPFNGNVTISGANLKSSVNVALSMTVEKAPATPTDNVYVKVTSTAGITNGEYLIVYEDATNTTPAPLAFNGALETLDASKNTVAVEISNSTIAGNTDIDAALFTIDVTAGTLKSASGKYIGVSSNTNGLKTEDVAKDYKNAFSIDDKGNAVIAADFEESTMSLRYNNTAGDNNLRFRYYKNAGQQPIALYKKANTVTIADCTNGSVSASVSGAKLETGAKVLSGTTITLGNTPATGHELAAYDVYKTGEESSKIIPTDGKFVMPEYNVTISATFQLKSYEVKATAKPSEGGTVTGADTYKHGESVTLTATANTGYEFVNWTKEGAEVSKDATYTFTATEDVTLVANFKLKTYTVTVTAENGTLEGLATDGKYEHGATVTLKAVANTGYEFVNWTVGGAEVSKDATCTFTASEDVTLVANFQLNQYTITATATNGSVTGAGTYTHGAEVSLTADPAMDYTFVSWTKGGEVVSTANPFVFKATENLDLVANFTAISQTSKTLTGTFSVGQYEVAQFATGNLQYTNGTWGFAKQQYQYVGEANINIGDPTFTGTIDMFGWSTNETNYGVDPRNVNEFYDGEFVDWGDLFPVEDNWSTLSADQWKYLLNTRPNASSLKQIARVGSVVGIMLFPDVWNAPLTVTAQPDSYFEVDIHNYTLEQWAELEKAGALFLPAAGRRAGGYGNMINKDQVEETNPANLNGGHYKHQDNTNIYCYYWTSTINDSKDVSYLHNIQALGGDKYTIGTGAIWGEKGRYGQSVRLAKVTDITPETYTRTVTAGKLGTLCLPFGGTITGAVLYECVGSELGKVYLGSVTTLVAGVPYIFEATATELAVYSDGTTATAGSHNGLVGTFVDETVVAAGDYILLNNELRPSNGEAKVNANRAYLVMDDVPVGKPTQMPGRRYIGMSVQGENETTGFDNIQLPNANSQKLIINGQLIIIRNGEKFNAQGQKL